LEALPEVGDRYLLVSHVSNSNERVVSLAVDADLGLLDGSKRLDLAASLLLLDTLVEFLGHLLSGDAY
jgi:hypothetical protein